MTDTIPVKPKLVVQSKGAMGAAGAITCLCLKLLSQQPWIPPDIGKFLGAGDTAALVCGIVAFIGNIDRKDLFFRSSKMQETLEQASKELTLKEAVDTGKQIVDLVVAPANQRMEKLTQLAIDGQRRLQSEVDQLRSQLEVNQMPAYSDYPDRTDLPSEPRPEGQHVDRGQSYRVPPPLMGGPAVGEQMAVSLEPDVLAANSEGVWDEY